MIWKGCQNYLNPGASNSGSRWPGTEILERNYLHSRIYSVFYEKTHIL